MKIPLKDAKTYDMKDFIARFLVEKKDGRGFNALIVDVLTRHYKTKLMGASRQYLVMEGAGMFIINDEEMSAEPGDFFIIESGSTYSYSGKMRLFEFNVPATDKSNEERLD